MQQIPSLAAFVKIAESLDVAIPPDEVAIMWQGYLGLREMLKSLPQDPGFFEEPATIFITPGRTLT